MKAEEIKDAPNMFKMRNKIRAGYKDIIHIYKTVWKALDNLIHQLLEGTSTVPEAKQHPQQFKQAERGDYYSLRNVSCRHWIHWILRVSFGQI